MSKESERDFTQILQELRVVQTGVQILSAFLLTLPFTARFASVGSFEKATYAVSLIAAVVSVALVVAPVACRLVVGDAVSSLVRMAAHLAQAGMLALAVSVVASLMLTMDVAIGRAVAVVCTIVIAVLYLTLWMALPRWYRRHERHEQAE
jgi:Family of unknown function (DUF6328)